MAWTKDDIQQQSGKNVIITGVYKGVGFDTAIAFAEKEATVILAVSDLHKGSSVKERILTKIPNAKVEVMYLDLNELPSIHEFAKTFKNRFTNLSVLILNETIQSPILRTTKDGFESQFGVNYLGHFALTGLLLDLLKKTPNSRVITLGNKFSNKTKLSFGHFQGSKQYKGDKFYTQSKLANMLFAKHLDEKFKKHNIQTLSICCQEFTENNNEESKKKSINVRRVPKILARKKPEDDHNVGKNVGSLPILFAATNSTLSGGEMIGLSRNKKHSPTELQTLNQLYDENVAHNLWEISEKLCGVSYTF
ncbi:SDR family NAD(P)-dependent oxidoreductase [Ureibacillus sp. MALMAid1270]|uniref:SDR family NAD(P)-dependent oxidoreductase n=1 Tax=Ureibacillus sp. MALMAid1270 TaxID=3411629 RepID=UPI003BA58324